MQARDLQLDWLKAFVAVVDAGSLSAAAPRIARSQSAVSMQLQKLEDAVGSPVLLRGPRQLELTETGQNLMGYARRLLDLHEETMTTLHGPRLSGSVSLGMPDDYAAKYLTPVLRSFAASHAGVEISLVCEQSSSLIPQVQRGTLDLAVISRNKSRQGTHLFFEPLVWVASKPHEAWLREPLQVAMYESCSQARIECVAALTRQHRAYRAVYSSASLAGQLAAVQSGLAVAVLTRCSVPDDLLILQAKHGLPDLAAMDVAVMRSKASRRNPAVDALEQKIISTLGRGV
jgi:DNA-binding transcriptional LysR family regulator